MKKILLLLLIGTFPLAGHSQDLKWYDDVNEAANVSIKTKKPLLLFFTGSDWCGWCIRLQKEVMLKPEFTKWANENVVLAELDFPRRKQLPQGTVQQNAQLQQMFGVNGFPTVWFVTAFYKDGKISFTQLGRTGYVAGGPEAWIKGADDILRNVNR